MTHGNDIHYNPKTVDGSVQGIALLGHEITHSVQYAKTWRVGFYYSYLWSYLNNRLVGQNHQSAYENIPQESEAYAQQEEILNDLIKRYGVSGKPCKGVCK